MPKNYIPFSEYLDKWEDPEVCPKNDAGEVQVVKHHVYVATDDPTVVRQEIADLPNHPHDDDPYTVLWKTCHEIKFYFSPAINEEAFHIIGGEGDTCFDQYHRNIVSMADMMLILKAKTIIVEFNSNWGRLVRNLRMRLNSTAIGSGVADNSLYAAFPLDTRIAWGGTYPGMPGE